MFNYYFLTEAELRERGWRWNMNLGVLKHPDSAQDIPLEMLRELAGRTVALRPFTAVTGSTNSRWSFTAPMLRCARMKTAAELAEAGWRDSGGVISPPGGVSDYTIVQLRDFLGHWLPTPDPAYRFGSAPWFERGASNGLQFLVPNMLGDMRWAHVPPTATFGIFDGPPAFADWGSLPPATERTYRVSFSGEDPTPKEAEAAPKPTVDTKAVMRAFRDADLTAALGMITCGFELETQKSAGLTRESYGEVDQTRLNTWCTSRLRDALYRAEGYLGDSPVVEQLRLALVPAIEQAAPKNDFRKTGLQQIRDNIKHDQLEVVEDGTVRGFEIRTKGGLTADNFSAAAELVFAAEHEINEECSFHIHIAVKDISHKYGNNTQMAMIEFLIEHMAEVPESVRKRWAHSEWRNEYFGVIPDDAKYSFVHKHPLNTWEFRCFGNVTNAADAKKCLELAVRALQHAYKVITGQLPLMDTQMDGDVDAWVEVMQLALDNGTSATEALATLPNLSSAA